jgi:smad nuclear-interacting protein 1
VALEEEAEAAARGSLPEEEQAKPDFGLSGALAKDERTGNTRGGVVLKYTESLDSVMPDRRWRMYVFKGEELADTLHLHRKPWFLFGRDERVADVHLAHPSCSKQHAVLQFRSVKTKDVTGQYSAVVKPYLIDLASANKTFLNGAEVEEARFYELLEGDVVKFGSSTRDYVLLHEDSSSL